ncbi:ABC transporter substrate-binding protein [Rhodoplanes sp. TEM]|uniref:ABC transporter substrate-binding protein n=1 Tax=Rhodoplanes tepidamans TaxID=200616 RepID=A0ABT5J5Y4_RHOTP|nr:MULTISPECIES: ABC transporter substrate-binding protein [Rhodoplanes]MDC7784714.1 ABC transporter substrate-binding protein [Rhodoplanes tepidamans]MDC7982181.1 ABC transporter substrate-binding protein [Rhodoplanes sp. TEM]MDQ0356185.1 ABC-type nitrate/sulfonate/bicarbonate transport system substrate-binding protein [Rhodoplanes tepidamans]
MKLAFPDMISNSYFPALAAAELGFFAREGLPLVPELIAPAGKTFAALADGEADFVAAEAHAALGPCPRWAGTRLVCALGQGMYWFLVMRADIGARRGDLSCVRGRRIAAAPFVELGLRQLLRDSGIDPETEVSIAPLEGSLGPKVNIGVTAAQALADRRIDGFWANGMGAEMAVRRGVGTVVLDVRRGDGPPGAFDYTFAALVTSDRVLRDRPDAAAATRRAIAAAHTALRENVGLAGEIGRRLFPPENAALIEELIRRDLPFYDTAISRRTYDGLDRFCRDTGLLDVSCPYEAVVAP